MSVAEPRYAWRMQMHPPPPPTFLKFSYKLWWTVMLPCPVAPHFSALPSPISNVTPYLLKIKSSTRSSLIIWSGRSSIGPSPERRHGSAVAATKSGLQTLVRIPMVFFPFLLTSTTNLIQYHTTTLWGQVAIDDSGKNVVVAIVFTRFYFFMRFTRFDC
jgi:hypothetical protein